MKSYCTQNNGDCETCSLASYGRDCQNIKIDKAVMRSYRFPPQVLEMLKEMATTNRRSISQQLIHIIEDAYKHQK